jgi:hypothetical protein
MLVVVVLALAVALAPSASVASIPSGTTGTGSISGTLTDFDGVVNGVVGAQLTIAAAGGFSRTVTSGPGGTYSFTGLPTVAGTKTRYGIRVSGVAGTDSQFYVWDNDGYIAAHLGEQYGSSTVIELGDGQSITGADLAGRRGGAIAGTLSFTQRPTPMNYYVVDVVSTANPSVRFSMPFAWGDPYTLAVPAGSYTVSFSTGFGFFLDPLFAMASNGVRTEDLFMPTTPVSAVVATSVVSTVNGSLTYNPNTARFAGTILGPDGRPVAGARVTAYYQTTDKIWRPVGDLASPDTTPALSSQALTRADGTFVLQLLGGSKYRIGVQPEAFFSGDMRSGTDGAVQFYPQAASVAEADSVTLSNGQTAGGDWRLPYGVTLSGTLVDPFGHSIAAGWGGYANAEAQRLSPVTGLWEPMVDTFGTSSTYALRHLPPGTYRVSFSEAYNAGLSAFYYGQATSAAKATTIEVPAVSQPTTITLSPSTYMGKCYSTVRVTPMLPTVRRNATVKLTAAVWLGTSRIKSASLRIYRSYTGGRTWTYVKTVKTSGSTGKVTYSVKVPRMVRYKFRYMGSSKIRPSDCWELIWTR